MENETAIVYTCIYCSRLVWFNRKEELAFHIYKEHLKVALELESEKCKTKVIKKFRKWLINE